MLKKLFVVLLPLALCAMDKPYITFDELGKLPDAKRQRLPLPLDLNTEMRDLEKIYKPNDIKLINRTERIKREYLEFVESLEVIRCRSCGFAFPSKESLKVHEDAMQAPADKSVVAMFDSLRTLPDDELKKNCEIKP